MIKVSNSNVNLGNESDGLLIPSRIINQSNLSSINNGFRPSDQGHPPENHQHISVFSSLDQRAKALAKMHLLKKSYDTKDLTLK